jgi:predicted Zn finger-like uncharacterized protein
MILTCPACTMRYIVSEGAIGPKGRTVRCANCGNQWHEEPEEGLDEELFAEESLLSANYDEDLEETPPPKPAEDDSHGDDFQEILRKEIESAPIPEGVRPDHEEHDPVLAQLGPQEKKKDARIPSGAKLGGFMTAALVWIFILAAFLFAHPYISRAFPPSNMLYSLIGLKPVLPGEGLVLEDLHAAFTDGKIVLKGSIINLRDVDIKVPSVMASIVDKDEKVIDQILIPPPIARIKAEGRAAFDVIYPKIPDGASNVTFAFSFIRAKPVEVAPQEEGHKEPEAEKTAKPEHPPEPEKH